MTGEEGPVCVCYVGYEENGSNCSGMKVFLFFKKNENLFSQLHFHDLSNNPKSK